MHKVFKVDGLFVLQVLQLSDLLLVILLLPKLKHALQVFSVLFNQETLEIPLGFFVLLGEGFELIELVLKSLVSDELLKVLG